MLRCIGKCYKWAVRAYDMEDVQDREGFTDMTLPLVSRIAKCPPIFAQASLRALFAVLEIVRDSAKNKRSFVEWGWRMSTQARASKGVRWNASRHSRRHEAWIRAVPCATPAAVKLGWRQGMANYE